MSMIEDLEKKTSGWKGRTKKVMKDMLKCCLEK